MPFDLRKAWGIRFNGNWKILSAFALTFLILMFGLGYCLASENIGPKLVIEERLFDAMEVKEGTVIEHSFKVLNTGDSPLMLTKVSPG